MRLLATIFFLFIVFGLSFFVGIDVHAQNDGCEVLVYHDDSNPSSPILVGLRNTASSSAYTITLRPTDGDQRPIDVKNVVSDGKAKTFEFLGREIESSIEAYTSLNSPNRDGTYIVTAINSDTEERCAAPQSEGGNGFTFDVVNENINTHCVNGPCQTAIGEIDVYKPENFVTTVFTWVIGIAGLVALILLVYSGYKLMFSRGDQEAVAGARETITSAVVGLLFIIFSLVILRIIGFEVLRIPGFG